MSLMTHLVDVGQHVGEAGGEDDAAPEADPGGQVEGHQAALARLSGAQPAPPDPEQRQNTWKPDEVFRRSEFTSC